MRWPSEASAGTESRFFPSLWRMKPDPKAVGDVLVAVPYFSRTANRSGYSSLKKEKTRRSFMNMTMRARMSRLHNVGSLMCLCGTIQTHVNTPSCSAAQAKMTIDG